MPRFFVPTPLAVGETAALTGADARHAAGALRVSIGEPLTLCDGAGTDYACTVTAVERECVALRVTLYMGLPKADKLELIIQKTVELGVTAVVPVMTARSIARVDGRDAEKKQTRWQRIAAEAAGQSGRGIIPTVEAPIRWREALPRLAAENTLLCYEAAATRSGSWLPPLTTPSPWWWDRREALTPPKWRRSPPPGGRIATLGPRILRCETAPLAALAVLMERSGNMQ